MTDDERKEFLRLQNEFNDLVRCVGRLAEMIESLKKQVDNIEQQIGE